MAVEITKRFFSQIAPIKPKRFSNPPRVNLLKFQQIILNQ